MERVPHRPAIGDRDLVGGARWPDPLPVLTLLTGWVTLICRVPDLDGRLARVYFLAFLNPVLLRTSRYGRGSQDRKTGLVSAAICCPGWRTSILTNADSSALVIHSMMPGPARQAAIRGGPCPGRCEG